MALNCPLESAHSFLGSAFEGCSFWRVLVRYLGGRLGKMSVVIKRAHLSSARKLAQGRTQALRKLSLGDVYSKPSTSTSTCENLARQARARLAQGRSARDPNWQPWNKDIEQPSISCYNVRLSSYLGTRYLQGVIEATFPSLSSLQLGLGQLT